MSAGKSEKVLTQSLVNTLGLSFLPQLPSGNTEKQVGALFHNVFIFLNFSIFFFSLQILYFLESETWVIIVQPRELQNTGGANCGHCTALVENVCFWKDPSLYL